MLANKVFKILIACACLSSCSNKVFIAPVEDKKAPPSKKILKHYVSSGETLYSIAWRYDLDLKKLAKVNDLDASGRIYPGQELSLDTRSVYSVKPQPRAVKSSKRKPTSRTAKVAKPLKPLSRSVKPTPSVKKPAKPLASQRNTGWQWPCSCRLSKTFKGSDSLHKGIELKAKLGEPIVSAASGEVVYSGDGLRGYGKLLIIKHSDILLSAYAHNNKLLVEEGDTVKKGQLIAKMGKSGSQSVKLHFEVRRDGKPVNPLKYLPNK